MAKNTAVIIVGHNHKKYLKKAITSLESQSIPHTVYYADNRSSDGSAEYISTHFPRVYVVNNQDNIGYGAANNALMTRLFAEGYEYCLIMNPDVHLGKNAIRYLTETHASHPNAGLVQPVILDADGTRVNTMGNASHYLGFGYCPDIGKPYRKLEEDKPIVSVSGACMLIHRRYSERVGGFDESFFLYNEDQDLSWRGLLQGYTHYVSSAASAYHDYDFSRHGVKWYHSHKNRMMMLLKNYSVPTLVLLIAPFIVVELSYLLYCVLTGRIGSFVNAYAYVISHLSVIINRRGKIQKRRTVRDAAILALFDASLRSPIFRQPAITYIVNPFLKLWYMIVSSI